MPLKLNVGLSRKVGEANYGSKGASVNLELELDSSLVAEPDRLQDRIRQLFRLAKASVDEELHSDGSADRAPSGSNGQARAHAANGNGHRPGSVRRATQSQVRALWAIAERQQVDLGQCLRDQFGVNGPDALSITQASQLIDELKGATSGHGGHR
jgi:hypothetical protein